MDDHGKSVADWQLERLAQGELDEASARALESKLGKDELKARLDRLAVSNREILDRLPPELVGAAIRRRRQERRPRRGLLMLLAFPLATAAAVWAVGFSPRLATGPDPQEITRAKGAARLLAYRVGVPGAQPARLGPAARVRPRDVVQLAYTAGEAKFGLVVSVDGRGVVTQHLPVNAAAPAPLAPGGETNLPRSYELDDAPGFERFFLVTGASAFSAPAVLDAVRALARNPDDARRKSLSLAPDLQQESLLLEKARP